ncbi:MAG: hypothetical protein E6713_07730 [Sporomusaceae bacterium]|nr:hypothetical protein [Sporomusaceae bacterium]
MAQIFTKGQCAKKDLYDVFLTACLNAGWQNISSSPVIDGDVLTSAGVSGDKKLLLRLWPYASPPSAANNTADSMRTNAGQHRWSAQLQLSYTPGASGTAGTFLHPSRTYYNIGLFMPDGYGVSPANLPLDALIDYCIFADKNKIMFLTKPPDSYTTKWCFNVFGLPDIQYAKCENGRGMSWLSSYMPGLNAWNQCITAGPPDEGTGLTDANNWWVDIQQIRAPYSPNQTQPNLAKNFFLSENYLSSISYGMIGKFEGFLAGNGNGISNGDTIQYNGDTYTCFRIDTFSLVYQQGTIYPVSSFWLAANVPVAVAVRLS